MLSGCSMLGPMKYLGKHFNIQQYIEYYIEANIECSCAPEINSLSLIMTKL